MTRRELIVPPEAAGRRLDRFVTEHVSLTRSQVQRLARAGKVTVDGRRVKTGHALGTGERVEIEIPEPEPSHIVPEPIPLEILFEDDDIVVIAKPPGLVVHPGAGNATGTLVNALVHHCPDVEGVGGVRRPGLVHRLDKGTSGVLVAAKRHAAYVTLVEALARREVRRTYLAIVWGDPGPEGHVVAPVGRHARHRTEMAVRTEGREAETRFRSLRRFDFASLLELTLVTGRTHQIRVHMSHIGCPVLGDPVYGGRTRALARIAPEKRRRAKAALGRIERQALHAWRLELAHPTTAEPLCFVAPPPEDFDAVLAYVEGVASGPA